MALLRHLVLLGVLLLSSCDKPVGVELPNSSVAAIQFDTVDCADFGDLMDKIGARAGSELSTIEIRHGAELFEIKVAALSGIDPVMIVVKGEAILMGEEGTPADMAALAETLGLFADGCIAAGCDPGVALFALEGADMNTGMAVIREMSGRGIHLWLPQPEVANPPPASGPKPSSPGHH